MRSETKYEGPSDEDKGEKIKEENGKGKLENEVTDDLPKKESVKNEEPTPRIPYPRRL